MSTRVPRVHGAIPRRPRARPPPGPGALIAAWGRLGYPRRARRLWEAAARVDRDGWPDDLTELPGVGRYTAAAIAAQVDDADVVGIEVNIRRVVRTRRGHAGSSDREAEAVAIATRRSAARAATVCSRSWTSARRCARRANPRARACPIAASCATRGVLAGETKHRQAPLRRIVPAAPRQRDGRAARTTRSPVAELDPEALASLVDDGLAEVAARRAQLPAGHAGRLHRRGAGEEVAQQIVTRRR